MNFAVNPTKHHVPAGVKVTMPNPWKHFSRLSGGVVETCDAITRLEMVRAATADRLRAFIDWPGTQVTVRQAAVARLRRLGEMENTFRAKRDKEAKAAKREREIAA